jgi:hypothetical protein
MFGAPLLGAALLRPRTRRAAAVLLLAAPISEYPTARPQLNAAVWLTARTADDFAYGTGVIRGCIRHRTIEPLRPRWQGRISAPAGQSARQGRFVRCQRLAFGDASFGADGVRFAIATSAGAIKASTRFAVARDRRLMISRRR